MKNRFFHLIKSPENREKIDERKKLHKSSLQQSKSRDFIAQNEHFLQKPQQNCTFVWLLPIFYQENRNNIPEIIEKPSENLQENEKNLQKFEKDLEIVDKFFAF